MYKQSNRAHVCKQSNRVHVYKQSNRAHVYKQSNRVHVYMQLDGHTNDVYMYMESDCVRVGTCTRIGAEYPAPHTDKIIDMPMPRKCLPLSTADATDAVNVVLLFVGQRDVDDYKSKRRR